MTQPHNDWAGHTTDTAERYLTMANGGLKDLSPTYERLCRGVAGDPLVLSMLDSLPHEKRQPNLLLGATRFLTGPLTDYATFRVWLLEHWEQVAAVMLERRTQTNEPGRCATFVPLLAQIEGPIALIEVGASAGLCLYPDRYAYRYVAESGETQLGRSQVDLPCRVLGELPVPAELPQIVWRAGLDLNPLDLASDADVHWLECLIWPEETERFDRLRAAVQIARTDPARIVAGDLLESTVALVDEAPEDATVVLVHTAVLAYLDEAGRQRFAEIVRDLSARRPLVWIAQEAPGVTNDIPQDWQLEGVIGPFVLSRNAEPLALVESRGRAIRWYG